jgi:N-acyl-D-amino-acid deacylase
MRAVGMVDIEEWMRHDWNGVSLDRGVDDLASCEPFTHPGTWGTPGRLIETFVKQRKTITLPYAIRSLTSVGAQALGLRDRGLLREGMMADVVVFDLEKTGTDATYLEPCKAQRGVEWVVVNGRMVVDSHMPLSVRTGILLRR